MLEHVYISFSNAKYNCKNCLKFKLIEFKVGYEMGTYDLHLPLPYS